MTTPSRRRKPTPAESRAAIRRLHGILRRKPGDPSFADEMAAYKAEERALEERRD
jgi:hypothetical protein